MSNSENLKEQKIQSKEIYDGRLVHLFSDEVRLPDGGTSVREWIKHPGASAVLPVFENGDVMLIRQFRYPVNKVLYEVPAGKIDPDEEPQKTAVRELKEETGLVCDNIHYLAPFYPTIGYSSEIIHLYCAWDITEAEPNAEDDEFLKEEKVPFQKAVQMVYGGQIADGKSMVNILIAWHWWQQNGPFEVASVRIQ